MHYNRLLYKLRRAIYKPMLKLVILDLFFFLVSIGAFFVTKGYAVEFFVFRYSIPLAFVTTVWLLVGYTFKKYRGLHHNRYRDSSFQVFATTLLTLVIVHPCIYFGWVHLSVLQSLVLVFTVFFQNLVVVALLHTVFYAVYLDEEPKTFDEREPVSLVKPAYPLEPEAVKGIEKAIEQQTSLDVLNFLRQKVDLGSSSTLVLATTTLFNVVSLRPYRYDMIINLVRLNDIRGINKLFCAANDKLPDHGGLVCCFEAKSTYKKRLLQQWPPIINWLLYIGHFIYRRIIPKLFITSRLYYDITQGKNRVLSNTEVLGRLYYCGFEVVEEQLIGDTTFVIARRKQQPERQLKKRYGPLIKLRRIGKNKKFFNVFKMRTMHPYAEYLQAYMFEKNSLQEGGKISNDIRVTTVGKFMRKYWLDEVPMFINVLRGDMKLVGVRPLSNHYFSLYSKELQEKRTKFRPGLLPPFYADMPKTLDEIQDSEMRYLEACEKHGCFITDCVYAWKIFVNILFRKARSN